MRNWIFIFSIIFTIIFSALSFAQQKIVFERLSVPDGLSSNNIGGICQDDYGYLWIATADGLNRYDGYNFEVFKYDPSDTLSLPASNLSTVYKDSRGIIWTGSTDGLSERNPSTGHFRNYAPVAAAANNRFIIRIFEDSQKRLWLGFRWSGLFLFDQDKKTFTRMKVESRGAIQEYGGPVKSVIETASGSIYSYATGEGLIIYNEQRKIFEIVDVGKKWKSYFERTFVWDMHEDKSGNLWMTTRNALLKYNPVQNTMQKIDLIYSGSKPGRFTAMHEDEEGYLWIGSDAGIFRYNLRSGEVSRHQRDNRSTNSLSNQDVWTMFEDSFGVLWIGTIGGGLNKYDRSKIPFDKYTEFAEESEETNASTTNAIAADYRNRDALWIGTGTGLWHLDRKQNVKKYVELPEEVGKNQVNSLVADEDGTLWIGTNDHGLLKYEIQRDKYTRYSSNIYKPEGLQDRRIYDIEQDDYGDLWIGTRSGLSRFDPRTGAISRVPGVESREYSKDVHTFIQSAHKRGKPLSAILEVPDFANESEEFSVNEQTDALIVSVGEGLLIWEMVDFGWLENAAGDTIWTGGKIRQTFHLNGNMKNRVRASIISLDPGNYKLRYISDDSHAYAKWNEFAPLDSAWWGIQILPISKEEVEKYSALIQNDEQRPTIEGKRILELYYSRNGELWVGTDRGLSRYDPKSGKVINYRHDPDNPAMLSDDEVGDILEDREGTFWIATSRGLNRFDPQTENFHVYHEKDGLPSDQIRAIAEDEEGNLWLSSINGITRFEKKLSSNKPLFINYDVQDGLQGYEFFWNSVYQYEDGELIFGGRNGINAFFPGSVSHSTPRVVLSDFSISNQVIRPGIENSIIDKVIMDIDAIELSYDQNDLSFAFSTIHFSRPTKNKISYRLDGYQSEWVSDNRRFVSFTNLDPGEYRFRVRGISGDGIPAKEEARLKITITPPWWTATWAYIMYGLIFISGMFAVDRIQRYRLILRERNRTQIREAELRAQAAEAESRALQIEHERKTHELEEARNLQLSLLPEKLPELPNLEIAVYMKTATEVGGDYYDFNISADGTLNIALGDATGHGMRAGTMVTLMKGLFSADSGRMDIDAFFRQSSDTIKDLRFGRVMMAFTLIKIKENRMLFSSAGMPPAYVYRPSTLKVDELSLNGMPLGAMKEFDYKVIQENLDSGDTLLLLSDGLPELKNPNDESFDYPRLEKIFRDVADEAPQAIIDRLVDAGEIWRKDVTPEDDVTLMVIKAR